MATDLEEALTAAGAAALVAKHIDPTLLEYQRRYAPVVRALPSVKWGSTVYYFNKRTSLPAGGFVVDGGARDVSSSNYNQENFQIRLLQSVGAVTGYSQAVTADLIGDLRAREIEGAARGLYWDLEAAIMWGAEAPTQNGPYPQFDGLDIICSQFSSTGYSTSSTNINPGVGGGIVDNYGGASSWGAPNYNPWLDGKDQNALDMAGANMSLGSLDLLIDLVESNVAEPVENSEWMFLMSPNANSRLSQLLVNQQRFVDRVEIEAGLIVPSYRGVPIVKTSFLAPRTNKMTDVVATPSNSGGTLANADGAYKYKVSAVIARFGEIQACTEVSTTVASGSTGSIALTFTPPTGPDGASATHYKVYRTAGGGSTNAETLLGIVDAAYYSAGAAYATNKITDTGSALVPNDGSHAITTAPTTYYYGNANLKPLTSNGEQNIFLMSRDPNYIVRPYVREMQPVNVYPTTSSPDSLPFAFVADTTLAVRAPKYIGRLANIVTALDKTSGNGVAYTASGAPSFLVD